MHTVSESRYQEEDFNGARRLLRHDKITERNRGTRTVTYAIYKRKNGTLFALPLNDADRDNMGPTQSTIGRDTVSGSGGGTRDSYLYKGMKWATLADVEAARKQTAENELRAAEAARMRDPIEMERMRARILAEAIVDARKSSGGAK